MEINRLEYKFKICTTIEEYDRAIDYFEKVAEHIVDLSLNDIEIIHRLKKGLMKQYKKYIHNLNLPEVINSAKGSLKQVYDHFSDILMKEGTAVLDRFLNCINILFFKIRDEKIFALMYAIRGSIFAFMNIYARDKSKYLELALSNYKKAVDICMIYLDRTDVVKYKIQYAFLKFSCMHLKDKYRSILSCFNIIDEMTHVKQNFNKLDEYPQDELLRLEKKYRRFYENNLEEYNKIIGMYHPEFKN